MDDHHEYLFVLVLICSTISKVEYSLEFTIYYMYM